MIGDPLSPFLFVVAMEALSRLFATVDKGLLSSFLMGFRDNDELLVSQSLFLQITPSIFWVLWG